jgi:hypothetical protein
MNRKLSLVVILAVFLILKANMVLFAQSPGNEQRLVGTWTRLHDNATLVFNANGTMSTTQTYDGFLPTHWAAAGDRLLVYIPGGDWGINRAIRYFHISSDGRTLIISTTAVEGTGPRGSIGTGFRRN